MLLLPRQKINGQEGVTKDPCSPLEDHLHSHIDQDRGNMDINYDGFKLPFTS